MKRMNTLDDFNHCNHPATYIGIGANLGDARANVVRAVKCIVELPQTEFIALSPLYESAPIGEGAGDLRYINAVAAVRTALTPHGLLAQLQAIEQQFGRERSYRNAPRTLDLDLLLCGDMVLNEALKGIHLTLPHPRMHQRAFVLRPLFDLAPELSWHNALGERLTVRELLLTVAVQDVLGLGEIDEYPR